VLRSWREARLGMRMSGFRACSQAAEKTPICSVAALRGAATTASVSLAPRIACACIWVFLSRPG